MSEFLKQTQERLRAERVQSEAIDPPTEPDAGDPEEDLEVGSVDDPDNTEDDVDPDSEADYEDGDSDDGDESEVDPEYKELQDKYKSLEAEYSRVTANRREIEKSLDTAKGESVRYRQELESKYEEATQIADYFAGMATQQLQQLQGINPAGLSQEQYVQYQQAFSAAQQQAYQMQQLSEQVRSRMKETFEKTKQREAEIARERLKTRIPDWSSEKYKALADVAEEYGFSKEEYFDSTDHRLFLLLNEVQRGKEAESVVSKRSKKTKPKPPSNRSTRTPDRNERGQFRKAEQQWREAKPGTKGAFAAMKAAQLRNERKQKVT